MSQNAFVKKRLDGHTVQVSLMRQMECGLSCMGSGGCDHCGMKPQEELLALASDSVGVQPGDIVEVDSRAGSAVGVSMLVFVLPIVTMILGYVLGSPPCIWGRGRPCWPRWLAWLWAFCPPGPITGR